MSNIEHRVQKLEESVEQTTDRLWPLMILKLTVVSLWKRYPDGFICPGLENDFRRHGFSKEEYEQYVTEAELKAIEETSRDQEQRLAYFYVLALRAYPEGDARLTSNENFQRGKELFEARPACYTDPKLQAASLERDLRTGQEVSDQDVWAEFAPDGLPLLGDKPQEGASCSPN